MRIGNTRNSRDEMYSGERERRDENERRCVLVVSPSLPV